MYNKQDNSVVRLYICYECHKRIKHRQPFTRYENRIYCDFCFMDCLDQIKMSDLMVREKLNEDATESELI